MHCKKLVKLYITGGERNKQQQSIELIEWNFALKVKPLKANRHGKVIFFSYDNVRLNACDKTGQRIVGSL